MCPPRRPSPGSHPPITSSWLRLFLIFSQPPERFPGSYGQSSRLATMPSSPFSSLAANSRFPPPSL